MNNLIDIIIAKINLFYDWLFSLPVISRNVIFYIILFWPISLYMLFVGNSMVALPPALAVLYVIYMLGLIIGFVLREEKEPK